MENQHRKITGYRELSAGEIALMNELKATEALLVSPEALVRMREKYCQALSKSGINAQDFTARLNVFEQTLATALPFLQTGFMWAVRAIAQPGSQTPKRAEWIVPAESGWVNAQVLAQLKDGDPHREFVVENNTHRIEISTAEEIITELEEHLNEERACMILKIMPVDYIQG